MLSYTPQPQPIHSTQPHSPASTYSVFSHTTQPQPRHTTQPQPPHSAQSHSPSSTYSQCSAILPSFNLFAVLSHTSQLQPIRSAQPHSPASTYLQCLATLPSLNLQSSATLPSLNLFTVLSHTPQPQPIRSTQLHSPASTYSQCSATLPSLSLFTVLSHTPQLFLVQPSPSAFKFHRFNHPITHSCINPQPAASRPAILNSPMDLGLPPMDSILRIKIQILQQVPKGDRDVWAELLRVIFVSIIANPTDNDSWCKCFMVSRCILFDPTEGSCCSGVIPRMLSDQV